MTNDELSIKLIDDVAKIRGVIINQAVTSERLIDEFLCNYFCNDEYKRKLLMELVISDQMMLKPKTALFFKILSIDRNYSKINYDNLNESLKSLAFNRNIVAHWLVNTTDDGIDLYKKGVISFIRFRYSDNKGGNIKSYNQKDLNQVIKKANKTVEALLAIVSGGDSSGSASMHTSESS